MHNPQYETFLRDNRRLLSPGDTYYGHGDTLLKEYVVTQDTYLLHIDGEIYGHCPTSTISYYQKHHPQLLLEVYDFDEDCSIVMNPDPCHDYVLNYAREKMRMIPAGTVIEWNKRIFPLARDISVVYEDDLPEKWRRFVIADWIEGFLPILTSTHNLLDTHEASFGDTIIPESPCVFNIHTVEYKIGSDCRYFHNAVPLPNISIGNSTQHQVNRVKSRYITTTEKIESLH